MSLESGKRLGTTASLIAVITPVIGVVTYVFLILSLFATIPLGTSRNSSFFPSFTIILFAVIGIIAFAGFILFVVAMHRLSQYYDEPVIYKNTLYGFIINIVGSIIILVIYVVLFTSLMHSVPQGNIQTTAVTPIPTVPPLLNSIGLLFSSFLAILGISLVLGVVSAVFYMRAFNKLGEKTGIDTFKTVGLLYLLGIVLSIVGVGILLVWIAWILALIGFRSIKPKVSETSTLAYSTPTTPPTMSELSQKRYCPYCGTENIPGSLYCRSCGKQLQ